MNKGFLVLEDGRVLSGVTASPRNAFGKVVFQGAQAKVLEQVDEVVITLDTELTLETPLVGKIVVDSLPIDYHMYDVKNTIV